ncbi:MAG TPA: protein kinase [Chthoniobacterales bacterium]|jgi:non-specific serine/threonine protein kinase/serine/threonine-protein kinase
MQLDKAERLAALVEQALELKGAARENFIAGACGDDAELCSEVKALLGEEEHAEKIMASSAIELGAQLLRQEDPEMGELSVGQMVGEYRIVSLLGEGGMGEVYLAEDTELGRNVAIKLIKSGFGTKAFVSYFRQEGRILAALNHPNIARLYGGGVTAGGLPYLVMEYVEGSPLTTYSREHAIRVEEKLALFRKICAAASYAHHSLILHRDLKPANIRVTSEGEPKLLDFGIARLLDPATAATENPTILGAGVMTPAYASPEQQRGDRLTTASDVYSLGIVLYEFLTGSKPRMQADGAPDLDKLGGDLDNIVGKAIRHEPERRYTSVGQFSEDIRCYLEGMPVSARKDTLAYRGSKFVRRHKMGLAITSGVALLLLAATVFALLEAQRANAQRVLAERRFEQVRKLADSLMFEIHDSVKDLAGSTPTRRLIVGRALEYLDSLAHDGQGNIALQGELATAYEKIGDIQGNPYSANIGDTDGALASYRKALQIREKLPLSAVTTKTQMELGRTYRGLGDIMDLKGDHGKMIQDYRRSLQIFAQLAPSEPKNLAVQDELARAYETLSDGLGRAASAEKEILANLKTSLTIRERLVSEDHSNLKFRRGLALISMKVGGASDPHDPQSLAALHQGAAILESLAVTEPTNGRARREVAWGYKQLGTTQVAAGDYPGAVESLRKSLAIKQSSAASDPQNAQANFDLAGSHCDLAEALTASGDSSQAIEQANEGIAILKRLIAADSTNASYARNLGVYYERLGDAFARAGAGKEAPAAQRLNSWSEAQKTYQEANQIFADLQARGALPPADAADRPAKFAKRMSDCRDAIEALGGYIGSEFPIDTPR